MPTPETTERRWTPPPLVLPPEATASQPPAPSPAGTGHASQTPPRRRAARAAVLPHMDRPPQLVAPPRAASQTAQPSANAVGASQTPARPRPTPAAAASQTSARPRPTPAAAASQTPARPRPASAATASQTPRRTAARAAVPHMDRPPQLVAPHQAASQTAQPSANAGGAPQTPSLRTTANAALSQARRTQMAGHRPVPARGGQAQATGATLTPLTAQPVSSVPGMVPNHPQSPRPIVRKLANTELGADRIDEFRTYKGGFLQRIVERADTFSPLTDAQRKNPEAEEATDEDRAKSVDDWASATGEPIGNGLDTVGSYYSSEMGGQKKTGFPHGNAIFKCIQNVYQMGLLFKQLYDYYKANKKEHDGNRYTTGEEKWEMAKSILDMIVQLADTVTSVMGAFSKLLDSIPIVGVIIGCASAAIGIVGDTIDLIRARKSEKRMREQRDAAKQKILQEDEWMSAASPPGSARFTREEQQSRGRASKKKVNKTYGTTHDSAPMGKTRAVRLDEKVADMKEKRKIAGIGAPRYEEEGRLIRDLEDYDVTRELVTANVNRECAGIESLFLDDITGFFVSLASLDATGVGSTLGLGVTSVFTAGEFAKKVGLAIRRGARNRGTFGANINKSDKNKAQRRHNLAVIMYDRIRELSDYGFKGISVPNPTDLINVDDAHKIRDGLPAYAVVDERITAMGITGPLARAGTAKEMVDTMRKGFYRETD